ncbi:amino acid transporter [mine drainage metagenome]|uniref:Amino acid transporter n=1 Tax=mine drainage metagenome TaxID=410659 RepID=T1C422_9ZZZZ
MVVTGMLALMPWQDYGISADPLSNALKFSGAPIFVSYVIAIVAVIATFTVTVSLIVAGSRTLLQMSEDKALPEWIQGRDRDSPRKATILIGVLAILALFLGNVQVIALASNFGVIFSYALTGLFVVILRHRKIKGEFSSPLYPWVQIISVTLSLLIMYALGVQAIYLGFITIIIGMMIYYFEKEVGSRVKKVTVD